MSRIDTISRNGYRKWWDILPKSGTLVFTYPKPGTAQPNPLYGTSSSSGTTTVSFTGCVAGWEAAAITSDGYRQKDDRVGKAILMYEEFTITNGAVSNPVSYAAIREIVAKPQAKAFFNGDAVTVTSVEDDPLAGSVVVRFSKVQ